VQQGDPIGSVLFALGNHSSLISIAFLYPSLLIVGYADNMCLLGLLQFMSKTIPAFKQTLQEAKMQLNTFESELHIPEWANLGIAILQQRQGVIQSDYSNRPGLRLDDGFATPIAHKGLKILVFSAGANAFCASELDLLCKNIEKI
jgi:hypothetical protein